jgi:hypothetical protein
VTIIDDSWEPMWAPPVDLRDLFDMATTALDPTQPGSDDDVYDWLLGIEPELCPQAVQATPALSEELVGSPA